MTDQEIGDVQVRDTTLRLAVRAISLLIILMVLWALGILRTGRNVVY